MIIWSGLGFLVPVVTFGACLLMNFLLDAKYGEGYYSAHHWAIGAALILGGLISCGVGLALRPRAPVTRSRHTFFFIPMHWAGLIIAGIGVGLVVYGVAK
jgi:hypothetical protein